MVLPLKDITKQLGIAVMVCSAVFVCAIFLNFNIDLSSIKSQITTEYVMQFYDAQVLSGIVISLVSGGCLLLTSAIMLIFYIKHEIDRHRKELGILKALGYSNAQIAGHFWVFGLPVFGGGLLGYAGSFLMMPLFYQQMNRDGILPEVSLQFHLSLVLYLVILPAIGFSCLAVLYSYLKLKLPALDLLRETVAIKQKMKTNYQENRSFLQELKYNTVHGRKTLLFFVGFASFCYSSMMQMSFSMDELASELFATLVLCIGIVLASTTLWMAISTVVHANKKNIAMMQIFGYSLQDCREAILNGYRPIAYIGFIIGTGYQYGLLQGMISIVFRDLDNVPTYQFDVKALFIVLLSFVLLYEIVIYWYTLKIKKIPLKEIMLES